MMGTSKVIALHLSNPSQMGYHWLTTKKNKSTFHSISNESHMKVNMIIKYNRTKGGGDNTDKMLREYSCVRRTWRWRISDFINKLDIGALNTIIIWISKNKDWNGLMKNRWYWFLLYLGKEMSKPNITTQNDLHLTAVRAIESVRVFVEYNTAVQSKPSTSAQQQSLRGQDAPIILERTIRKLTESAMDTSISCVRDIGRPAKLWHAKDCSDSKWWSCTIYFIENM